VEYGKIKPKAQIQITAGIFSKRFIYFIKYCKLVNNRLYCALNNVCTVRPKRSIRHFANKRINGLFQSVLVLAVKGLGKLS